MESILKLDVVTGVLVLMLLLLTAVPALLFMTWRFTRPPFGIKSFRWMFFAWTAMLLSSSVWSFSKEVRHSLSEAGSDNFIRLGFLMVGISLILMVGARYRFSFLKELASGVFGLFLLFGLWSLATMFWSVSPANTLYKSVEYLAMLAVFALGASLINRGVRWPENRLVALKSVIDFSWMLVLMLIVSVYIGLVVWPDLALQRDWRDESGVVGFSVAGVMPGINDNAVGQLGATISIVAIVRMMLGTGSKVIYGPLLMLGVITMVITQSRSPILAFAVAVVVVMIASRKFRLMALAAVGLLVVLLSQYGQIIYDFMRRGQSTELLFSLTGRVGYWESSFTALRDSILGGYGANAGGRYVLESILGESDTSTVHSTWVEVLIDTGVVGFTLFTVATLATWVALVKYRPGSMDSPLLYSLWVEIVGVFTVLFVRSFFAVTFAWSWKLLPFGAVLVFIGVMRRERVRLERNSEAAVSQPRTHREDRSTPKRRRIAGGSRTAPGSPVHRSK